MISSGMSTLPQQLQVHPKPKSHHSGTNYRKESSEIGNAPHSGKNFGKIGDLIRFVTLLVMQLRQLSWYPHDFRPDKFLSRTSYKVPLISWSPSVSSTEATIQSLRIVNVLIPNHSHVQIWVSAVTQNLTLKRNHKQIVQEREQKSIRSSRGNSHTNMHTQIIRTNHDNENT